MLIEREGSIATVIRETEKESDTDELISRRDDISLQGTVTAAAAAREAGEEEEEDMTMRVMLSQSVNTAIFASN
ncbi:hypothetical protein BDDG_12158 [Blastomyces dermatitidis ATCC 18188]|uniref:Uncharacterized protein n=1 Tax=Ajellomyces dermatitidis (strain ATCC 18188 / CBS 674.68) TaxID=653446 RepID=A0A0J9HEK9_AJEDA|nr:hypothetical protein BDDG_12158 [Blastomyces dermatitidis ATCC 18188]